MRIFVEGYTSLLLSSCNLARRPECPIEAISVGSMCVLIWVIRNGMFGAVFVHEKFSARFQVDNHQWSKAFIQNEQTMAHIPWST